MAVLAPHLEAAHLAAARELVDHVDLASLEALQPLAMRHLELGEATPHAIDLLERLDKPHGYWRGTVTALPLLPAALRAMLDHDLIAYLDDLGSSRATWFIQDYAAPMARALPLERLLELAAGFEPHERVVALGSLCPHLPTDARDQVLVEALTTAKSVTDRDNPMHVFIQSASWLSDADAKTVLLNLLGLHRRLSGLMCGDDGAPREYPGMLQLVPIVARLGGEDSVIAAARAINDFGTDLG